MVKKIDLWRPSGGTCGGSHLAYSSWCTTRTTSRTPIFRPGMYMDANELPTLPEFAKLYRAFPRDPLNTAALSVKYGYRGPEGIGAESHMRHQTC